MKLFAMMVAGLLSGVSASALAAPSLGYVDVYGVAKFDLNVDVNGAGDLDFEGDGYGIKGAFTFADRFFASAEYQKVDYELDERGANNVADSDFDQLRAGLGTRFEDGPALFYARGEYLKLELSAGGESVDEDGYGIHAGVRGENGRLGVTVEGGYLDVGDFDGFEWLVEADYRMFDLIGLFVGYRWTQLSDNGVDLEFSDIRAGATFYFGGKSV